MRYGHVKRADRQAREVVAAALIRHCCALKSSGRRGNGDLGLGHDRPAFICYRAIESCPVHLSGERECEYREAQQPESHGCPLERLCKRGLLSEPLGRYPFRPPVSKVL